MLSMTRHQESPFKKSVKTSNKSTAFYKATNSDIKTTDYVTDRPGEAVPMTNVDKTGTIQ